MGSACLKIVLARSAGLEENDGKIACLSRAAEIY
jgi:hypothetical protein